MNRNQQFFGLFSAAWKTGCACAAAVWLAGTGPAFGQFYLEAGPWARGGMELKVDGGSAAADEGVQAASPVTRSGGGGVVVADPDDDGSAQILRTFSNGYVGPSGWEWAADAGQTQYFAYESESQYNATANTLSFVQTAYAENTLRRTETRVTAGPAGWRGSADLEAEGALATVGCTVWSPEPFAVSLQLQAGWLGGMDASFRGQPAWSQEAEWIMRESRAVESREWVYVYDTLGNPFFPTAPYEMTDPAGVGPMISDRPTEILSRDGAAEWSEAVVGRSRKTAVSRVDLDVEMDALVLTLGPRLRFRLLERVAVLVEGGVTATLLDAEMERTETLAWDDGRVIRSWRDREDEQQWLWGGTISAGVQWTLTDRLTLMAAGGYDWVEGHDFAIGPDRIDVDLDGWRATLAAGWSFGGR